MLDRVCPVELLEGLHGGQEVPAQSVEDIDEASYVDARHLAYPPHGDAVEVVHDGDLRGDVVPVEASGKDRGLCGELLLALRALFVVEAVEDILWFPWGIVDDCPLRFPEGDKSRSTVRTAIARISFDDEISRFFGNRGSSMARMAYDCPSLLVRLFLCRILFQGFLCCGCGETVRPFLIFPFPVPELRLKTGDGFLKLRDLQIFLDAVLTVCHDRCSLSIEGLFEVFFQGIAKDIFEASVGLTAVVVFAPAGGETEVPPVGRFIAGPPKSSLRIDKGLQPYDRMMIGVLPVRRYLPCHLPQKV